MKKALLATAMLLASTAASAQVWVPTCPPGTQACNLSQQQMGDTTSSADNSQSQATQSNPSSNSNASASDVTIDPSIQQSGNAVNQNGNSVQGGAANATGNRSDNRSSATTGASTSSSGGNTLTGGDQHNSQGQGQSSDNRNSIAGGNQSLTGGDQSLRGGNQGQGQSSDNRLRTSADNSGGNSAVGLSVDASDRSSSTYQSKFISIPGIGVPTPVSFSPSAYVSGTSTTCGPATRVVRRTPVIGIFHGFWGHYTRELGYNEDLVPAPAGTPAYRNERLLDGSYAVIGQQLIVLSSVVNLAGARSVSVGGGNSSGSWVQGGGGSSSSETMIVAHIIVNDCEVQRMQPAPPARIAIIETAPAPTLWKRHVRKVSRGCPKPSK